jgi:hypothetical protein
MGKEVTAPQIFAEGKYTARQIADFKRKNPGVDIVDIYAEQLDELFEIMHPNLDSDSSPKLYQEFVAARQGSEKGSWVFLPWSGKFVHMLNEADFLALRTNRNQYLITSDEQQRMQQYTVGVLGLSVGGSMALALSYSAAAGRLKLADKDVFSTSNMNRVRIAVDDIGRPKLEVAVRDIYEANPYAKLDMFEDGVTKDNLPRFVESEKFILLEEIDDFEMKVRVRLEAKKQRVPVVMFTNLGDNILIDVERYDLEPELSPFNGTVDGVVQDILSGSQISEEDKKHYAVQIVGAEHVPTRALESVRDIGRTLAGRPQLYSSVAISGGLAAYVVRRIALGESLPTGRYFHSFADIFGQPKLDLELTPARRGMLQAMKRKPPLKHKYVQPPQLDPAKFLNAASPEDKIAALLEYAVLSPSTHNTQPWKLKIGDNLCQLYIDRKRQLPAADELQRDMYISLGAFLKTLETAATAFGVYGHTDTTDQADDLVAEVHFVNLDKKSPKAVDEHALQTIRTRSNYRGPFAPLAVADSLREFIAGHDSDKIKTNLIEDREAIGKIAGLTAQGLRMAYSRPAFRREISSWINPNTSRKKSGIPGYSLRMPTATSHFLPRLMRFKDIGAKLAELNHRSLIGASAIVILSSESSEPKVWLAAGQAAQSIFLRLEDYGAAASIFVAAVETSELNGELKKAANIKGAQKPQFLFCIGNPLWPKVYSPRESLKSKLIR